eukprot:TRINITY_DN26322_c0_g1_i1.p1 TRINITY_DN26322_c0_g1~~TRINITY_DN26322_c0_g1_i1.p1  ORF type:complete len:228 (-),score=49.83 TRINITY_DN26322_c0_g1_i1:35-616(-)
MVDLQLAFSTSHLRLGMKDVLRHVPATLKSDLSSKEVIPFDDLFSQNLCVWVPPIDRKKAMYAVDDIHRIEAILRSQRPLKGSYQEAARTTQSVLQEMLKDPNGLKELKDWVWFSQRQRQKKHIVRSIKTLCHCRDLRTRATDRGSWQQIVEKAEEQALLQHIVEKAEEKAKKVLEQASIEMSGDSGVSFRLI